jgi:chromosomal replication initiator protein
VAPWRGPEHHVIAPFPRVITVNDIIKIVAAEFDMTREQIAGSYRKRKFAFARHLAQYLATRLTAQSLPVIARQFFRDHTSVLHGVRRIKLMMESDRETRMLVERLETKLRSSHEQTG